MALTPEEKDAAELFEKWLAEYGLNAVWETVEPDPPDLPSQSRGSVVASDPASKSEIPIMIVLEVKPTWNSHAENRESEK